MNRLLQSGIVIACAAMLANGIAAQETPPPAPLTRETAIMLALQHHPALREERSRTDAAHARVAQTRAAQRLQLGLTSHYTYLNEQPQVSFFPGMTPLVLAENTIWLNTAAAQQVIYSGGRLPALSRQAEYLAGATETFGRRTRQRVAFEAERAYYLYYAAARERDVAQLALQTAEAHRQVAQARYEARAVAQFDVLHADVRVQENRQMLQQADTGIAVAQAALLRALGVTEGAFTTAQTELQLSLPADTLDALLAQAEAQRPELQALDWQIKAAGAAVTVAQGERKPTVSLAGSYVVISPAIMGKSHSWSLAAVASMPVLDGGAATATVREAEAQRQQLLAQRDAVRDAVRMEVRQAYARMTSAATQVTLARKRVEEARELLRIANVRYAGGVGAPTEVADAETMRTRAEQGLTRAQAELGIAAAEVRYATGAPIVPAATATVEEPR